MLTQKYEEVDLLQTKEEKQRDRFILDAVDEGAILPHEFVTQTDGQLLHVLLTSVKELRRGDVERVIADMEAEENKKIPNVKPRFYIAGDQKRHNVKYVKHKFDILSLSIIANQPGITVLEIAEKRDRTRQRVSTYLKELEKKGLVSHKRNGLKKEYMVTDLGIKYLKKYGGENNGVP
jgi:predicted transcriptional regulator